MYQSTALAQRPAKFPKMELNILTCERLIFERSIRVLRRTRCQPTTSCRGTVRGVWIRVDELASKIRS